MTLADLLRTVLFGVLIATPAAGQAAISPTPTPTVVGQLVVSVVYEGAAVPGARVEVSYLWRGEPRAMVCATGTKGVAVISGLPGGAADVAVDLEGFQAARLAAVGLGPTGTTGVLVKLKLAGMDGDRGMVTADEPIDASGKTLWTPTSTPTATPTPADMAGVRCSHQ